jgi:hypothetical protein
MIGRTVSDRRLLAMGTTNGASLDIPGTDAVTVSNLLASPEDAAARLSKSCLRVFQGHGEECTLTRQLDVAAYGKHVEETGAEIWKCIRESARS